MSQPILPASETRALILKTGISESELDQVVERYRRRYATVATTEPMLYYMIAQKEYRLNMPAFNAVTPPAPPQLALEDINFQTRPNTVTVKAYVVRLDVKDGKNGDNVIGTIMDGTASRGLNCYFADRVENMLMALTPGKSYIIEGLGVWRRDATERFPASATLTWSQETVAREIPTDFLPDAAKTPLKDRQPCTFAGFVTEEDVREYEGCSVCKKSTKNGPCPNHQPTRSVKHTIHTATVTDSKGSTKFQVDFTRNRPSETLQNAQVSIVGTYNQHRQCIDVYTYEIKAKAALPTHSQVLNSAPANTAPRTSTTAPAPPTQQPAAKPVIRNMTPDEVLLALVQKFGASPRAAISYKLSKECGYNPKQTDEFLKAAVADGRIKFEGETVRWSKV